MREDTLQMLEGGLIVSCQPVDDGPLDTVAAIVAFALAADVAGARALRIEGAENVAAVRKSCNLPIVGIVKRDLPDFPIRITPDLEDIDALATAGASIIAVDATDRDRPVALPLLLARIHHHGCLAMADLSTIDEAVAARALGFDIIGTTMSGYTGEAVPKAPDLAFVAACRALGGTVVAEGRFNTPQAAAQAMRAGASAVCVGSAITRTEHVVGWFKGAVDGAVAAKSETVLALDIGGTKILAALVRDGRVLDRLVLPTPPDIATKAWFAAIARSVEPWRGLFGRCAVAATGIIEDGHWSALNPVTLAIPERTPLVARLETMLDCPVVALNDAQAAAWGEYVYGAGKGQDMVFLTVSSGIGGGIVLDGKLLTGARGLAGSLGQIGGRPGEPPLETLASGFAIARLGGRTTPEIFASALDGDAGAIAIIEAAATSLAQALVDLQRLIDPQVMVIGGGVGLLPMFQQRLRATIATYPLRLQPRLVAAELGSDAGAVGAAAFPTRA